MTRPELDDATRIRQACRTIETCWPEMLPDAPKATLAGTIGRTQSDPLPIPVHILDTRAEALVRLAGWAMVVADDMDLHTSLDGTDAPGLARFVAIHADYLATLGSEPVDELGDSARKCDRIVAPDRNEAEYVGPCQECGFDLYRRFGTSNVTCRNCGKSEEADKRVKFLLDSLADRLMTPSEMARAVPGIIGLPINPTTLAQWKKCGRLVTHGVDARGRDLFRVSEVLDLVKDAQMRRVG